MELIRKRWIWMAAGITLLLFYFVFDPMESRWMPQCVFHKVTGLQCMGCGAQRMMHSILHGDIRGAINANAFLFFSLPLMAFMLVVELYRVKYQNVYRMIHSQWTIIIISALLLAWLILRNILKI